MHSKKRTSPRKINKGKGRPFSYPTFKQNVNDIPQVLEEKFVEIYDDLVKDLDTDPKGDSWKVINDLPLEGPTPKFNDENVIPMLTPDQVLVEQIEVVPDILVLNEVEIPPPTKKFRYTTRAKTACQIPPVIVQPKRTVPKNGDDSLLKNCLPPVLTKQIIDSTLNPKRGLKNNFRSKCNVELDYELDFGVSLHDCDPREYAVVDKEFLRLLCRNKTCEQCGAYDKFKLCYEGKGISNHPMVTCTSCNNIYDSRPPTINGISNMNLAIVQEMLGTDSGQVGYNGMSMALGINDDICNDPHRKIRDEAYKIQADFYKRNLRVTHQVILAFYLEYKPDRVKKVNGKYVVTPIVSIDGTYSEKGKKARYCGSIIIDHPTGFAIDFELLEKCRQSTTEMREKLIVHIN